MHMEQETHIRPDDSRWESLLKSSGKHTKRIQTMHDSLDQVSEWNFLAQKQVPQILLDDQTNLLTALTGASRKMEDILNFKPGMFGGIFSGDKLWEKIYSTEKSIAFAKLSQRLIELTTHYPDLRPAELQNIIAATAVKVIDDFSGIDVFTFAQLTESALSASTIENRNNSAALADMRDAQIDVKTIADTLEGSVPIDTALHAAQQGTILTGVASKIISPALWTGVSAGLSGVSAAFRRQHLSRISEHRDIYKLISNIVGNPDNESFQLMPVVAINSALIIPIEINDARDNRTDYQGMRSPIPE